MHGSGERGTNNVAQLVWGANELLDYALGHGDCYFVAGQVPDGRRWSEVDWSRLETRLPEKPSETMARQLEFLEKLLQNPSVDRERVYATGVSMGGYGTWDLIMRRPEWFAGAMPICGGGDIHNVWKIRLDAIRNAGAAVEGVYAGVSGDTSRQMLARLEKDVLSKKPDYMFLSCGVNDAPNGIDNPGVPLAEYRRNMTEIINRAKKAGVTVILLEPTPVLESEHIANVNERAYVDALREIAAGAWLTLVPVNRAFTAAYDAREDRSKREYTCDGTHMNQKGNRLLTDTIIGTLL